MHRTRALALWAALAPLPTTAFAQLITSFETDAYRDCFHPGGAKVTRVKEHATHGEYALRAHFPGSEKDTWPGISYLPKGVDLTQGQVLAFDVYNPAKGTVHLSWRIDGKNGKKIFAGQSLPARRKTTVQLFLKGLDTQLGTKQIERIYPYIRMPRADVVLYLDHWRVMDLDLRFTPLVYEETAPALSATKEERDRGYVIFARHWLDVVFPNSRPGPGQRTATLQAFATPGEHEPMTFSVHALRPLAKAAVSVSDLRGPAGAIASERVTVYPVRCMNKRVTYSSNSYVKDMPVLLERRSEVDLAQGQSKRFWLDVHVPDAAPAGVYRGTATFRSANGPAAAVALVVRVLPFKLHEPADMIWGEYYQGPKLAKDDAEGLVFLERDLRDMRAHGATSVGLCIGTPATQAKMTPQGAELNLDGSSLWEHFMDLYKQLGFPAPVVQLSDSGQAFASENSDRFMDERYAAAYKAFWAAVQQVCKQKGWPEIIVQPVDEPGWRDRTAKDRNVALLKLLKQIPGMRTEQDGPGDAYFHHEAGPYSDVWNYNGGIGTDEVVAAAKKAGRIVMLYNCDVESYRPEIGRYAPGFFQKRAGTHGCYNWAYMSWRGSPYDDLDHTTGTWMHVYPPHKDEVGGPSTGWQGFREGVDDYKYIATLELALARARASATPKARIAAREAERTLQGLLDSIAYSPRVRSRARWTHTRTETKDGRTRRIISGTLKVPNGWTFAGYDLARWQVAQATLEIMAALGETPPQPQREVPTPEAGARLVLHTEWQPRQPTPRPTAHAAPRLSVPVLAAPPRIDGHLNDAAWTRAAKIDRFTLARGGAPLQQTQAWLCVDQTHLYIAFHCHEDNMAHLTANVAEDGGQVWEDDCVEVFIDANADRSTCCQIVVNSLGKQYWSDEDRPGWRARSAAAARTEAEAWFVELAIPLADVGLTGSVFGINLCRERRPMETLELSCWRPTGGTFRQPHKFALAKIGMRYVHSIQAPPAVLGDNALTVDLVNPRPTPLRVVASLTCAQESRRSTLKSPPVSLAGKQTGRVVLPYRATSDAEPARLVLELRDPGAGELLVRHNMTQEVSRAVELQLDRTFCYLTQAEVSAQIRVTASEQILGSAALALSLVDGASKAVVRSHRLAEVRAGRLLARLHVGGLPAGRYELAATLTRPGAAGPLSEARSPFTKVAGPFD